MEKEKKGGGKLQKQKQNIIYKHNARKIDDQ